MILLPAAVFFIALFAFVAWQVRKRHMDRWLLSYLAHSPHRRPRGDEPVHLLLCIADHYEPKFQDPPPAVAQGRVSKWRREYPRQFARFRDSDGRTPRHTFFYPAEEYEPQFLDSLAELVQMGFGEVEIHLHHDNDTDEELRQKLIAFRDVLAERHGLLGRHRESGEVAYAFIHGNWSLCNSRPDGRYCGVNNEIDVLRQTGCVVDMTMPSAPHPTQTSKINSIYYAADRPGRPRSHDTGIDAGKGQVNPLSLLMIQGPLVLDWARRKWGIFPRLENGCLQASQPPSVARLAAWLRARVQVAGRPDWYFVKLHCHGAAEDAHEALLGEPMARFHQELAEYARRHPNFHYHYVTAREMVNLARAAEAGWAGDVAGALDYEIAGPPLAAHPLRPEAVKAPITPLPCRGGEG